MSEYINNHTARQETLKALIRRLHDGATVDEVKAEFAGLLGEVGATEISEMEQALIAEGIAESEIKRLCDVHVAVFRESLDTQPAPESIPGHPIHTFRAENAAAEQALLELERAVAALGQQPGLAALRRAQQALQQMRAYDRHYVRKENILFPFLERHGFSGPSKVMWAIHDDVRAGWKWLDELLSVPPSDPQRTLRTLQEALGPLATAIREMFYKEEHILFPTALEKLDSAEWVAIRAQEADVGYAYVQPGNEWQPEAVAAAARDAAAQRPAAAVPAEPDAAIPLQVGALTARQIDLMLTHLPVDITVVDEHDEVRFFSQTRERIFPRSPAIIGRKVQNCHPPASVHRVQQILDSFRKGTRDEAEFWINLQGRLIHIRYVALRDEGGTYRGTLEVSQDVTHLRSLEGERRLLDE